jgi:hypothetical protein
MVAYDSPRPRLNLDLIETALNIARKSPEVGEMRESEILEALQGNAQLRVEVVHQIAKQKMFRDTDPRQLESLLLDGIQARKQQRFIHDAQEQPEKRSWLGRQWDRVKSIVPTNKWLRRAIALAAVVGGAYIGIKYMPSWDQIMAWVQRLRGVEAAQATSSAVQATPLASPPLVNTLVDKAKPFSAGVPNVGLSLPPSTAEEAANMVNQGMIGGRPLDEAIKNLPGNLPNKTLGTLTPKNPAR